MSARSAGPEKETAGPGARPGQPRSVVRSDDGAVDRARQKLPQFAKEAQETLTKSPDYATTVAWQGGPAEFRAAAATAGLDLPATLIADGQYHRFSTRPIRPRDDAGWYVLHHDHGVAGDWRRAGSEPLVRWSANSRGRHSDAAEIARLRAASAIQRDKAERRDMQRRGDAAREAQAIWAAAGPAPADHGYLAAKGVQPHGLRISSGAGTWRRKIRDMSLMGCLIIPLRDASGRIQTLEFVSPAGAKRFLAGGRKQGCCYEIPGDSAVTIVCEGYATGSSLHEATGYAIACAMDAGNLRSVAQALRAAHPDTLIIIAGDHDAHGAGQRAAQDAARAVGGIVAIPAATGRDWNDVHRAEGREAVRAAIDAAIRAHIESTPEGRAALTAAAPAVALSIGPRLASAMERAEQPRSEAHDQARAQIENAIRDRLARIAASRDDTAETAGHSDSLIIRATVGLGKSSSAIAAVAAHLAAIHAEKLRVVLVVNGHEQTRRYADELAALGVSAKVYDGRTGPEEDIADDWRQRPTTCWQRTAVLKVAEQHHPPAAAYCRQCPHGLRAAAEHAKFPAQQYEAHERYLATCQRQGLDPTAVQPCKFLYEAMPSYLAAPVLVVPYQAYTDRLVRPEPDSPPCAVIVDEDIPLMRDISVTLSDIDAWRARIERGDIHILGHATEMDHPVIFAALRALTTAIGERGQNPGTIAALRRDLDTVHATYAEKYAHGGTWVWEAVRRATDDAGRETGEIDVPLRALEGVRAALACDGATATWGDDLVLRLTELTALGERVCGGGTVLLDATVDDDTIAALRARSARNDREIHLLDVHSRQHAALTMLTGVGYTRGRRTDPWHAQMHSRYGLHVAGFTAAVAAAHEHNTRAWGIITHRPIAVCDAVRRAIEEFGGPVEVGYWGRDERAHNRWSGRNLILAGLPYPSPAVQQARWDRLRACDPTLPETPPPEFATRLVAADVVQAIGRSRAIYAPGDDPIRVIIAAHVTPELRAELEKYGLHIAEERRNPLAGRAPRDKAAALRVLARVLDQWIRGGHITSTARDTLESACRQAGLRIASESFRGLLDELVPPTERGGKRYRDQTRYALLLIRRAREALLAIETVVRRTIESVTEGMDTTIRPLTQRLLAGLGDLLGLQTSPTTGPPLRAAPA